MLSASVMAQTPSSTPPPPPAPDTTTVPPLPPMPPDASTNKPPGKVKKKKKPAPKPAADKAKDKSAEATPPAPLVPSGFAESKQDHVNIRGQAHINSEVIGHLKKGDTVTVLEEITLNHPKTDEPAKWARIALPADIHVWANSSFIDASNQVVKARKLNLRTGHGENYSVIGMLNKGDAVKTITNRGSWTEIEAPTNAFAFVAAHLLAPAAAPAPVQPPTAPLPPPVIPQPPTPTIVENSSTVVPPPVPQRTVPLPPIPAPLPPPVSEEPLPKRVVEREGIVGGTFSIQAPSHYELKSLDNGQVMNYLYTTSTNVMLKNYKGLTVHVSGEEELDERWPNTPVITIQRIQLVK